MEFDSLSNKVIRAALNVHTALGPGLFEEVYKVCLRHELLKALSEVGIPVTYDRFQLEIGYRIDLLVENTLIFELKSVEKLRSVHKAQLLTYLKLAHKETGLLLNFNTPHLKEGIIRVVNSFPTSRTSCPFG